MRITPTRHHRAARAAALTLLLAACATSGPVMDRWTAPPVGSTWEMAQRNTGSFGKDTRFTVTRGDMNWKGAPAVALTNSMGITTVSDPATGNFISFVDRSGKEMISYDPPIGWDYPLKVGKSWSRQNQRMTLHATGKTLQFDLACKVEDFEKLQVTRAPSGPSASGAPTASARTRPSGPVPNSAVAGSGRSCGGTPAIRSGPARRTPNWFRAGAVSLLNRSVPAAFPPASPGSTPRIPGDHWPGGVIVAHAFGPKFRWAATRTM